MPGNISGDPDQNLNGANITNMMTFRVIQSPVDIDKKVHGGKQDECHATGGHDEADGPEVFVDGNDAVIQREAREAAGQQTCEEGPDEPADHLGMTFRVERRTSSDITRPCQSLWTSSTFPAATPSQQRKTLLRVPSRPSGSQAEPYKHRRVL